MTIERWKRISMANILAIATLGLFFISSGYAGDEDTTFDPFREAGFNPYREFAGDILSENIDPFSGSLTLAYTDLSLPGNGGLDLKIQRTYSSSRIWNRTDINMLSYNKAQYDNEPMGLGWSIHMGRVINPGGMGSANRTSPNNPVIVMPDGSTHVLYRKDTNLFITKDYWLYKLVTTIPRSVWQLTLTDGTVYTFEYDTAVGSGYNIGPSSSTQVAQVTRIEDVHGNYITINYGYDSEPGISYITSIVQNAPYRTVLFQYNLAANVYTSMSVDNPGYGSEYRVVATYTHINANWGWDPAANKLLSAVTPAAGNSWQYTYYSNAAEDRNLVLQTVTFPTGGTVTYNYAEKKFCVGKTSGMSVWVDVGFLALVQKTTGGIDRDITPGTWTYAYDYAGDGYSPTNKTTVTDPGGKTITYTHWSWKNGSVGIPNESVWKVGLLKEKKIGSLHTETNVWETGANYISNDTLGNAGWIASYGAPSAPGVIYDSSIYVPRLQNSTIVRSGKSYSTNYSNYDSYGQAKTVAETGQGSRNTTRTYWYNTTKNIIKGKIASESVVANSGGTFSKSFIYATDTGKMTSETIYGVTTAYVYYSDGNLQKVTNAKNYATTYSNYEYGKAKTIAKPESVTITRTVDFWGNILSVKDGNLNTTSYTYDNLDRLTNIDPPGTKKSSIQIAYPGDHSYRKVTQSSFEIWDYYDGFGRSTGTLNAVGVKTKISFNARGDKTFTSYPYTGTNIKGENMLYDDLGRVTSITRPLSASVSYTYTDASNRVTIKDERLNDTVYTYQSFGDPEEKRLQTLVLPGNGGTTTYSYNSVGSLTLVDAPVANGDRTFEYNTKNFKTREIHKETGAVTYTYDAVGNIDTRVDALGTTDYTYDQLDRLTRADYPGTVYDATYTYDKADNIKKLVNAAADYAYDYNEVYWLTKKTATVKGRAYATLFDYDSRGNNNKITYPTGRILNLTYNNANQATDITGFVSGIAYHPSGITSSMRYQNGITLNYAVDDRSRVTSISDSAGAVALTYLYDKKSNINGITGAINSVSFNCPVFVYDTLDRLTQVNGPWGNAAYGYDELGNIKSKTIGSNNTGFTYNTLNRLASTTGYGAATFSYDNAGNMTGDGSNSFAFNALNQLISANSQISYGYDGNGARVYKVDGATVTVYHLDPKGNIIAESTESGASLVDYVYLNEKIIASIRPTTSTTTSIRPTTTTTSIRPTTTTTSIRPTTTTTSIRPTTTTTSIRPTTTTTSIRPTTSTTTSIAPPDADGDGVSDAIDNCPDTPNGPILGTCTASSDQPGVTCTSNADCVIGCSSNGTCSMGQEDADADGIGDVCEN